MSDFRDKLRQKLITLTTTLVDIPTENNPPDGDEREGQELLKGIFANLGLDVDEFSPMEIPDFKVNPAFLQSRNLEDRKNVVGVWKGSGGGKSLVLSGHMDVAPKEPLPWTVCQPFKSVVRDGKIYGRGTSDMKGGFACALAAIELLYEEGFCPRGDIMIESVVDEEFASGNGTIASRFRGYNGEFAVVFEPSGLRICPANVGGVMINITIKGNPGMPYTGEKIFNIAYALGDMLHILRELEERREEGEYPALWDTALQKRKMVITKVKSGEVKPHGQLGCPIDAWIEVSVQTYPGETVESVLGELTAFIKERFDPAAEVKITPLYHYVEPGNTSIDHPGVLKLKECADKYNEDTPITCAPFPCDLFAFQKYGNTNGVIFGPVGGNLHAPDEWVDIESMEKVSLAIRDFIIEWCG